MARFPYLFRSRHGVYKYRRAIPQRLRDAASNRREWIVSLNTKDASTAHRAWADAHAKAEGYFRLLEARSEGLPLPVDEARAEALRILADNQLEYISLADLQRQNRTHAEHLGPSGLELRLDLVESELGLPVSDPEQRDELIVSNPVAKAILGDLPEKRFRLSDAKALYLRERKLLEHQDTSRAARQNRLRVNRVIAGMIEAVGADKEVQRFSRENAMKYRDWLLQHGNPKPATVNRYLNTAQAILELAIVTKELVRGNPFARLKVADNVREADKRWPLAPEEVQLLLDGQQKINEELGDILVLLACTGARLKEITGLALDDISLDTGNHAPFVEIRANDIRGVKNRNSMRQVPLVDLGLKAVRNALCRREDAQSPCEPLFPRYGRDGGNEAASQALMKSLRSTGIDDARKGIHSLRHSMKDALRAVGCPEDIRDEIQGHGSVTVARSYGSGHSIDAKHRWLTLAFKHMIND